MSPFWKTKNNIDGSYKQCLEGEEEHKPIGLPNTTFLSSSQVFILRDEDSFRLNAFDFNNKAKLIQAAFFTYSILLLTTETTLANNLHLMAFNILIYVFAIVGVQVYAGV